MKKVVNKTLVEMKTEIKHPVPPFNEETAKLKVQMAEDSWNSKDPVKVSKAYTVNSEWRNRTQFINGRAEIVEFLTEKWNNERHYKLKKELWGFKENRMAVRFEYEFQDNDDQWYRAYGNELWEFDENGLMQKRYASINDLKIEESNRRL